MRDAIPDLGHLAMPGSYGSDEHHGRILREELDGDPVHTGRMARPGAPRSSASGFGAWGFWLDSRTPAFVAAHA